MPDGAVRYTDYHPRWLRRRVSTYWWLERRSYLAFILRELSSVAVAWSVVYLLMVVYAIGRGDAAVANLLAWSRTLPGLAMNATALLLVGFHAITWFNLAPKALVVRVGRARVPGVLIAGSNYLAWAAVSAGLAWVILGG